MTTAISVHRCLAGADCRHAQQLEKRRQGAPTDKPNTLCPPCLTHISSAIRQLPDDWAELRQALGERATNTGQRVHSTPTPAIPISTRKEAIMAAIVETADRAAAVVADQLDTEQPTGRRKTAPEITVKGQITGPRPGTPADHAEDAVRPTAWQAIAAAIAITEPNIALLATAPPEPALVWKRPTRCDVHERLITAAEDAFSAATKPRDIAAARERLNHAYHAAGVCEDCGGWCNNGQARELIEQSGIQIALALVELHNQARAELGLTKLRHRYRFPCPDCGGRIYRNDGESIVYCENDPKHTRTEREYKLVAGQLMTKMAYMEIREYFLAEAYWRLDRVQRLIDIVDNDPKADTDPRIGRMILDHLKGILTDGAPDKDDKPIPHQTPQQRVAGTDRKSAIERQVDEDNWTWRNEPRYQKPNPKRRKATRPADAPHIHAASLTTLTDINENAATHGKKCAECNLQHAGECA